jgi:hypothetical protein
MGKIIISFVMLSAIIAMVTIMWRQLSGKEQWQAVKTLAFAMGCSIIAIVILSVFVILF